MYVCMYIYIYIYIYAHTHNMYACLEMETEMGVSFNSICLRVPSQNRIYTAPIPVLTLKPLVCPILAVIENATKSYERHKALQSTGERQKADKTMGVLPLMMRDVYGIRLQNLFQTFRGLPFRV